MRSAQWLARNGAERPPVQRDEAQDDEAQEDECVPLRLATLTAREYRHARRVLPHARRAGHWLRHAEDPADRARLLWLVGLLPTLTVALNEYEREAAGHPWRRVRRRWRRLRQRRDTRSLRRALNHHRR
jgi:hypothetical protein